MKRMTYTEYAEVRLDVLTTVDDGGNILVDVIVGSHGRAQRKAKGHIEVHEASPGRPTDYTVYDENDQHTGIVGRTKKEVVQRFTRRQMALMAQWAIHDTLDGFREAQA